MSLIVGSELWLAMGSVHTDGAIAAAFIVMEDTEAEGVSIAGASEGGSHADELRIFFASS